MLKSFFILILLFGINAFALSGLDSFEQKMKDQNHLLKSLKIELDAKKELHSAAYANNYPQISAIAGWGNDHIIDPYQRDKGYFGYLQGQLNLFHGFRDQALLKQRQLELELSQITYEKKYRELKVQLIEVASAMIYLHKLLHILELEEQITNEQKQMALRKHSAGLTSQVDNFEVDLRKQEIQIQMRQINQLHQENHEKMTQLFGTDIPDSDLEELKYDSLEALTKVKPYSNEANPDLKQRQILQQLSDVESKAIQGETLPSVDFIYALGALTPQEISPLDFNESKYSLQISIPFFAGVESLHKKRAAKLTAQSAFEQTLQTTKQSVSSFNILISKLNELSDLYKINEQRLETSKKYFDITVGEYKRGIKNSPDLVGATERWFSSQKKKYELLNELELTKVKIEILN